MNTFKQLVFAGLLALAALAPVSPTLADTRNSAPVITSEQRVDASSTLCSLAGAVNATQAAGTCTITPPQGQSVYITYLGVGACMDGTLSISSIQQNFTSTNLGGLVIETSGISGSTITTNPWVDLCAHGATGGVMLTPLKSAQPGLAVTIVPPTQAAHLSFPITVLGYFAP